MNGRLFVEVEPEQRFPRPLQHWTPSAGSSIPGFYIIEGSAAADFRTALRGIRISSNSLNTENGSPPQPIQTNRKVTMYEVLSR